MRRELDDQNLVITFRKPHHTNESLLSLIILIVAAEVGAAEDYLKIFYSHPRKIDHMEYHHSHHHNAEVVEVVVHYKERVQSSYDVFA